MQDFVDQVGVGFAATFIALIVLFVVTSIITWWKLYAKAGEAGWKYIVPVYSTVIMARIARVPEKYGWLAGVLSVLSSINHPVGFVLSIGYVLAFVYIVRDLIKQYNAPINFWIYAIILPVVAVFRVDEVKYTGAKIDKAPKLPKV
jgi:hypothetical protein